MQFFNGEPVSKCSYVVSFETFFIICFTLRICHIGQHLQEWIKPHFCSSEKNQFKGKFKSLFLLNNLSNNDYVNSVGHCFKGEMVKISKAIQIVRKLNKLHLVQSWKFRIYFFVDIFMDQMKLVRFCIFSIKQICEFYSLGPMLNPLNAGVALI